ncbi:uncharacterized protein LOC143018721 [Oratosquilla oratoria]|uniref:uncharacterized protein LOC143018721 n=1 Tax=Oratosquilla oratoria TaxID=337810 RepID=UPI003F761C28
MLNEVDESLQFIVELEVDHKLPFLDTMIHRATKEVRFSVYRKPTSKDDFIHYLPRHSARIKSGVIIEFYLRAIRISNTFRRLLYPLGLLNKLKRKATNIYERYRRDKVDRDFLALPYANGAEILTSLLSNVGIHVAYASGRKIKDIVRGKEDRTINKDSIVYSIPCGGCSAVYYGETSRGLAKRIGEHKKDLRHQRTSNSVMVHAELQGHLPTWENARHLRTGLGKRMRKLMEATHIVSGEVTNHREGYVNLSFVAARLVLGKTAD